MATAGGYENWDMQIEDNTPKVLSEVERVAKLVLEGIGSQAEGFAKDDCPVDTGLLRNSLTWALGGKAPAIGSYKADRGKGSGKYGGKMPEDKPNQFSVYVGTNVVYAPIQEFKDLNHTSGKAHFLKDAIANHSSEYESLARDIFQANLE